MLYELRLSSVLYLFPTLLLIDVEVFGGEVLLPRVFGASEYPVALEIVNYLGYKPPAPGFLLMLQDARLHD